MTTNRGNGKQFWTAVLTKKLRARFRNASKHIEITIGVLRNRDVTKTRGNGERFWAVVLTKIPRARFRNASKHLEINMGVLRNRM